MKISGTLCGVALVGLMPLLAHAEEPAPIDQAALNARVAEDPLAAFIEAFDAGDELTEAVFTSSRGVGARVSEGVRFTRMPRADLGGPGEWATHMPPREGGPQAQSCIACHAAPLANGAGALALNVAIDPLQTGDPAMYLERNTLHLFALGGVQRVAEEMTADLQDQARALDAKACSTGAVATGALTTKDVAFGQLSVTPQGTGDDCVPRRDMSRVEGIDDDLVVRMFGWKGTHATIRDFSRGAAHNELGLQAVELVGDSDGDHDGVTGELTVGDMTALTVYIAGLERPTSRLELDDLGVVKLDAAERAQIETGQQVFSEVGCASCHKPVMLVDDPVFSEPSRQPGFYDIEFPSGANPEQLGLNMAQAMRFDMTRDVPNNRLTLENGREFHLGAHPRDDQGRAIVTWYSDFRRHDMGPALADPIDAYGFGASVWPTRSLAGVGSTGPWLHHGHATTLDEAIRAHGGDAQSITDAYIARSDADRAALVAFLENLIIENFDPPEDH